jgi:hypothetical protein
MFVKQPEVPKNRYIPKQVEIDRPNKLIFHISSE